MKGIRGGEMKRNNKNLLRIVLLVCLGLACLYNSSGTLYAGAQKEQSDQGLVLNVCCMRSDDQEAAMAQIPKFEQQTGIKVNVSYFTWNDMMKTAKMDFATKAGSYDLVTGTAYPLSEFVAAGWVEPIDKYIEDPNLPDPKVDDILPALMDDACIREGKTYGFPFTPYVNMFGYRRDLFEEYGISKAPDTFDEMLDAAIKCTKDTTGDGKIDQYGLALFCVKGDPLTYDLGPYLWSYGSCFVNTDTMRAGFTTPEGMAALKFYADFILEYKVTPPGVLSFAHAEFIDAMRTGLTSMGIFFQEAVGKPMEDPQYSQVVGKIDYALIPAKEKPNGDIQRNPHLGAFGLFINKYSKNKEAAYRLMQFICSQEVAKERLLAGGKPFRYSDFEIPEAMEKYPYFTILKESLVIGSHIPQLPEWRTIVEIFIKNYHEVLSGSVPLESTMNKAAEEINKVLAEAYP